jgi:hypothetical protein
MCTKYDASIDAHHKYTRDCTGVVGIVQAPILVPPTDNGVTVTLFSVDAICIATFETVPATEVPGTTKLKFIGWSQKNFRPLLGWLHTP